MISIVEPRKFQVLALLIFLHNADSSNFIFSSLQKYRILHIAKENDIAIVTRTAATPVRWVCNGAFPSRLKDQLAKLS